MVSQALSDADSVPFRLGQCELEGAEQSGRAWDGYGDEAQLAKVSLPLFVAHSLALG